MKQIRLLLPFLVLLISSNGTQTRIGQNKTLTSTSTLDSAQDKSCRQTIQRLYSVEEYCPNNLEALQQLFTEEFNQKYKPSLDRCNQVNKYHIIKLLSISDKDFPATINAANSTGSLIYYVEIETESKSGMALGNNPSALWIYMKVNGSDQCKIDEITGGG